MGKRGTSLQGRFVDAVGALSPEIEIAPTLGGISEFHVASNGHLFLVVWRDWSPLYRGTIITAAGQIQAAFEVMTAELTFVGDLVAMRETFYALTSFADLAKPAMPIAEDGTAGAPIAIAPADTPVFDLQGAPSGNGLLAAWTAGVFIAMVNERRFVEEAPSPIAFTLGGFGRNIATSGAQIVYAREIGNRVHDVMRVFVRTIERTPNGPRRRAVRP